jgi:PQQ enzyme repeat
MHHPAPLVAGVTAASGGVLFTGDLNNDFFALDAMTGGVLYHFNTGGSIGGCVITYALDGKHYVAATSGTVSAFFGELRGFARARASAARMPHWNRSGMLLDAALIRPRWAASHPPTPAAQLQKPD